MPPKLGIIAGGTGLPRQVGEAAREQGRDVFILALSGMAEPAAVEPFPHAWCRLGAFGRGLRLMRGFGAQDICFVGAVTRPGWRDLAPDLRMAWILLREGLLRRGDDGAMRRVARVAERLGFNVIGPHEIVGDLLSPNGVLTRRQPDRQALTDIRRGWQVAAALGRADAGQATVVQQGIVLTIEAAEGTDAMLGRAGDLRRRGPGGVLVKRVKPQQDRRLDLPTIGIRTVTAAAAAGLRGIAVSAEATILADGPAVAEAADREGLFLVGYTDDGTADLPS